MSKELRNEIRELMRLKFSANETFVVSLVVHEIVASHPEIYGDDADWYRLRAFDSVGQMVRAIARGLKIEDAGESTQLDWLKEIGFKKLQPGYIFQRDGVSTGVPLLLMTDEEIIAKEEEHGKKGDGEYQHRDELRRFRLMRASLRIAAQPVQTMEPAHP